MAKKFLFICGSSSVGKTTLVEQIEKLNMSIKRVEMSFRNVREQLGNPTWTDLITKKAVAQHQQREGMTIYLQRIITSLNEEGQDDTLYVFERSPLDICGYSSAFANSDDCTSEFMRVIEVMKTVAHHAMVKHVYRPVQWNYQYDTLDGIRPASHVREVCDNYLIRNTVNLAIAMQILSNFEHSVSIRQDQHEVEKLATFT